MADEQLQQGGVRARAPAAGRRLREGQLQVPRGHPTQVRQVGGQDRPAHGQEVINDLPLLLYFLLIHPVHDQSSKCANLSLENVI